MAWQSKDEGWSGVLMLCYSEGEVKVTELQWLFPCHDRAHSLQSADQAEKGKELPLTGGSLLLMEPSGVW